LNPGWRFDYPVATPKLTALPRSESICLAQRFSDPAPRTNYRAFSI
jgi:exonuclease III